LDHRLRAVPSRTLPIIYFDNNATTRPSDTVVAAMNDALATHWHNPSSVHRAGQAARQQVELARQSIADLIGVKAREVTFTSGGTEAIDLAVRGVLRALPAARQVFVTTRIEHAAVRDIGEELDRAGGGEVQWASISRHGLVDLDDLRAKLTPEVGLVSIQWANNETGIVQPVAEIAALCRERNVLFHCDATQWVGKMPVETPPADLLTLSPHKFHGPKGVGVLWARSGVRLRPLLLGTQELGRRGGTENVPGIIGAGVAAAEAALWLKDESARAKLAVFRDGFERHILAAMPGAVVNGLDHDRQSTVVPQRLWNTTNIGFPRLEAEALLMLLSEQGVCASAGAACSSGSLDPSPVLLAMGVPEEIAHGSVRFSLSRETTHEEVEQAAAIVVACVHKLRRSMTDQ
jgi:cysteine desulfurase